jgi:hypothetical protein
MYRLADTEHVAIRMLDVHLAHAPRLVLRRTHYCQTLAKAGAVYGIDIVRPDR